MKAYVLALLALIGLAGSALAQPFPAVPPGQGPATGGINRLFFALNSPPQGYEETSQLTGLTCAGTTQTTATLITTRLSQFATCAAGAGVLLPAVNHYVPIVIMNRGANAMLVYPTVGDTLETAAGTLGAANAPATVAAGADATFRPIVVAGVTQWMQ